MELYKKSDRKKRMEIEGLRAVAALLVGIYHIWFGNVSGGVDVFFVVSGFLITTSLLSMLERTNKIDILGFLVRLTKRLFPAAFTVLFVVTLASIFLLPELRWHQTISETFASALYYQNWQLAINSVDYLAQNNEASPFQHYWAMSIQGQFYLIWPLLLIVTVFISKFLIKKSVRSIFLAMLIFVFIISFSYSIYLTNVNQPWAYFDTFTRVWEFSLGGLLALLIANIQIKKSISAFMGWLGLFGLISCGMLLQVSTVFPGYAALWPTLSAALILLAGNQGGKFGVHTLLSSKPLVTFGSISYGFYLWHWPILIFYYILSGNEQVSFLHGLSIMLISVLLSYLTTTFVEKPLRKSSNINTTLKTARVSLSLLVPVLILTTAWYGATKYIESKQPVFAIDMAENEQYPGATVLIEGFDYEIETTNDSFIPRPIEARRDLPKVYNDGCHQKQGNPEVIECKYGEGDNYDYTIAVVGGSHSAHWLPTLEVISEQENFRILSYTKSSCRFSNDYDVEEDCQKWNENLMDLLINSKPDLIFTTADVGRFVNPNVPKGFVDHWERLNEHDLQVLAIRDNPWFEFDVPTCVYENGVDSMECIVEREQVLPSESAWSRLENPPLNVHYMDLSDYLCDEKYCGPVVGNVLVYRDKNHITATYAKTIAPMFRKELLDVLEVIQK
ncbi:acyltransferase family protein [Bacillus alkalicellulosilyticus]|uniref:acyltransferase family protein n=1 Tax=Alkalihalobacterium alkalicellulosilyticum TaxID=1912214 RepID=UPI000997EC2E|nr:acyltransferase family protein [Bacillus alkalicellulosilyticus]